MPKRPSDSHIASVKGKRKHVSLSTWKTVEILQHLDKGASVKTLSDEYGIGTATTYDRRKQKDKLLKFYGDSDLPRRMDQRKTLHQAKNVSVDKV